MWVVSLSRAVGGVAGGGRAIIGEGKASRGTCSPFMTALRYNLRVRNAPSQ
jgi:hypothetical protein